jgi:uncharacterized membrane protein
MSLFRWSAGLGLLGELISLYLTAVHYAQGSVPLACAAGGIVNCEEVTSSAQSMIGPLPVAGLGLLWFAIFLALTMSHTPLPYRLLWASGGMAFVLYLLYAELFLVGALCLWCTAVHLLVAGLFLLTVAQVGGEPPPRSQAFTRSGG